MNSFLNFLAAVIGASSLKVWGVEACGLAALLLLLALVVLIFSGR